MSTTATQVPEHLTDQALRQDLDSPAPGTRRRAEILLPVPPEARLLISRSATRRTNMTGGRHSDNLWLEAKAHTDGRLTEESFAEAGRALRGMGY